MTFLHRLASMARWVLRRDKAERDLHDELQAFVDIAAAERMRDGVPPDDARRLALVQLGGVEQAKERVRAGRYGGGLDEIGRDLRVAVRMCARQPGFSAVIVLTLGLGIGANTAIFSLIDSLMFRRLPVRDPDALVLMTTVQQGGTSWSYPVWDQIRRQPFFDGVTAWSRTRFDLASRGETQFVDGLWASGSFFETLGVGALIGRTFSSLDDHRAGGPDGRVAVISHRFWQGHFGGTADVLGRSLALDGVSYTIVGVTPPAFFGMEVGRTFDVAAPLETNTGSRGAFTRWLTVVARLRPGDSRDAIAAALRAIQPRIRTETLPANAAATARASYLADDFALAPAATGRSDLRRQYQRPLLTLMGVVAIVLVVACANIANLLLARATARRHELSVRLALGASRWRLARQMLVESVLLAAAGAALGLVIASLGSRALVGALARQTDTLSTTVFLDLSVHWHVLAFAMIVAVATTLLFGAAPAIRASSAVPLDALKEGRGVVGDANARLSSGLVVIQLALSVVLVVGAGLFVRTFASLVSLPLGFDPDRVIVATVSAQRASIGPRERIAIFERAVGSVASLPNLTGVAASLTTPVSGRGLQNQIDVPGRTIAATVDRRVFINHVSPGWFRTLGTPLVDGRDFTSLDIPGAPAAAIVNEAFVRTFVGASSPLGQTITGLPPANTITPIVGVVKDAVYQSLREPVPPTVYLPFARSREAAEFGMMSLSIRPGPGSTAALIGDLTAVLEKVNPDLSWTFRSFTDQIDDSITQERITAGLAGFFGVLALLLSGLGLYGVTAYAVNRRRSEISIRLALGADPRHVISLVVSRVAVLVAIGAIAGTAASLWLSRFIATLLYGVEPQDPITLAGAVVVLVVLGLAAAALPAIRAASTEPAAVLRES